MSKTPTDTQWADLVARIKNAGGATTLTSADYNYPESNPTSIAPWLLDNGEYVVGGNASVTIRTATSSTSAASVGSVIIVMPDSTSGYKNVIMAGFSATGVLMYRFNSTGGTYVMAGGNNLARKTDINRYITNVAVVTNPTINGDTVVGTVSTTYSYLVTLFYSYSGNLQYSVLLYEDNPFGLDAGRYQFQCQKYTVTDGFVATYLDPDTFNVYKLVHPESSNTVTITKSAIADFDTEEF